MITENMGVKIDKKSAEIDYTFYRKGGRSIVDRKPIFSPDGESILIIIENIVRVYNIQTGDCTRILEPETIDADLISVYFPQNEEHNLYGCSKKGSITIWTWEKGAVLREKKLQIPDHMDILTFDMLDNEECFITAIGNLKKKSLHLGTYSLKTGQVICQYNNLFIKYLEIICVAIGWCRENKFAAICNGTKSLYIQNLTQPYIKTEIINYNNIRILSVTAHAQESCVAITDALGRATVIRGNLYNSKEVAREVMHWHYLPLITAAFSQQGSYLLTGGLEKVLVKWAFGNLANKAHEKEFIPRLPGSIRYISLNVSNIAITLTNNTVVIANAQMRVVSTILECGGLSPASRVLGTSLVFLRSLGALLLGGRSGHLQFYSTTTDKVLYNIDITQQNHIPPSRENLLPLDTEVTCAAISANGSCLVTSEYRNDGVMYTEEKLKFWMATKNNASPFLLNTCVNLSHGGCNIISLALDNLGNFCVSAGSDQKFRVWKKKVSESRKKKISWYCLTVCYYYSGIGKSLSHDILNNFKSTEFQMEVNNCYPYMLEYKKGEDIIQKLINISKEDSLVNPNKVNTGLKKDYEYDMGGVAISQDGSLIAAWFGCKLTLWDTHLCNLRTTLSHMALRPKGVDVQFGKGDAAHYLVCTTNQCLAVWSLLSLTVKWIVRLQPSCLTSDPFSNKMSVVTNNNDVFIFTPHSSTPILTKKELLNPKSGILKHSTFGTSDGDDIRLYMMRNDSEIYCLERADSEQGQLEIISRKNLPKSNFSVLLAEQQLSGVQAPVTNTENNYNASDLGKNAIAQFFSAAPHMIPPVNLLCSSFLEHISCRQEIDIKEEQEAMEL